ncbi:NAD(P)H-quinone oxidoreductase [Umezawaea sp. Da 62-37]|uniref:NAD(P)H-quinone oxidoreductase n=1 Tax=Umezawaea sp. Da 62-37 TaxID=3075927 RepID=UPI0028F70D11|nr:NAD(P)H-quinone oxidoreductase [Umezawaea sp. Da 62-37]WNV85536.1 NAD(P)H-quinone oxidoreductase [Umezawaea sp. Da 62-37]
MRAIVIEKPGGHGVLVWTEVPDPVPGPGEVVVDVAAAAVNRGDLGQRQGFYPPPPGEPPYPGLECSGVVTAVGPGVADWHVGLPVCALLGGGGYAEKVAVRTGQLLPVPRGVPLVQAAALPEAACTVWFNAVDIAGLRRGRTLLVHGGGSGIGTFAIQLDKALGATVVATARQAKHERLYALGADLVVDHSAADFVAATLEHTGGRGADVVLDIVGADYLARNIAALAPDGHIATIGLQGGLRAELDFLAPAAKSGSISATGLRTRAHDEKARIVRGVTAEVWPLVETGAIRPVVDRTFPMAEAAEAHRVMETGDHVGKLVLVP